MDQNQVCIEEQDEDQTKSIFKNPSKSNPKRSLIGPLTALLLLLSVGALFGYFVFVLDNHPQTVNNLVLVKQRKMGNINTFLIQQNVNLSKEDKNKFHASPFSNIQVDAIEDSDNEFTLRITDSVNPTFTIPEDSKYFPTNANSKDRNTGTRNYRYEVLKSAGTLFKLERELPDGSFETIFDTTGSPFSFSRYYNYIQTSLNNDYLYGFGERRKAFRYSQDGKYTTWPKDQYATIDYGSTSQQLYGYHPMWLKKELSGNWHVGFLKSTSALETDILVGRSMGIHITGGNIILKFFLGDKNPETPIKAYHRYINGYAIHPFWSQGYHQSRWGYKTSRQLIEVRDKFEANDIPLDTIWNDLDYMVDYQDFTLSPFFKPEEIASLTDSKDPQSVKWVPLIDMGVAVNTDAAKDGIKNNAFLISSVYNKPLVGCVWPGPVYFPDFNHPAGCLHWKNALIEMKTVLKTNPGGFWIDMNENSNFIPGERSPTQECPEATPKTPIPYNPLVDDSTYLPYLVTYPNNLANKTLTMSALHYNGDDATLIPKQQVPELYFHTLNGYVESIVTFEALKEITNQPLVFTLSRSTFYGSGKYSQHWTGDNYASWDFFKYSVSELLPFQLFGIPMVGQDICGFAGNTTAELCARWYAIGAWTPFSRNHNSNVSIDQEPYAFPQQPYVLKAARKALKQRYSLLKWYYSVFVRNYENAIGAGAGTVMKPLWWLNPEDQLAYTFENNEFLVGDEFLIIPVLTKGDDLKQTTRIKVYFPSGNNWVNPENGYITNGGTIQLLEVRFDDSAPSYRRLGSIVPIQEPANRAKLLNSIFHLSIALRYDTTQRKYIAQGEMMSLTSYDETNVFTSCLGTTDCIVEIKVENIQNGNDLRGVVTFKGRSDTTKFESFDIDSLIFYGLEGALKNKKIVYQLAQKWTVKQATSFQYEFTSV